MREKIDISRESRSILRLYFAFIKLTKKPIAKRLFINKKIRAKTVRVIGPDPESEQLGIMGIEKALALAEEKGLDLAEVAPKATPPVCKILDYGKYQYHLKKVETKHRKMQKKNEVKGVRIGFKTGDHDIQVRVKQAQKFLKAGNSVKVSLIFRGREAMYKDLAKEKMLKFFDELSEFASIDTPPKKQGNTLLMILKPNN